MHNLRFAAFHKIWLVSVPCEKVSQMGVIHAAEHGWVCNLVTVQVQDGKNGAVACGIQELVRMPTRSQRPCFRLAIADHAANQEVRVIKCGAVGVRNRIAQFAALMNRAWRLGSDMARNAARE